MISRTLVAFDSLRPGESLLSFLVHLAAVNTYRHSALQVVSLCKELLAAPDKVAQPHRAETYQVLSKLTGVEAAELYAASPHYFATTLTPPALRKNVMTLPFDQRVSLLRDTLIREHLWPDTNLQFCPLCLQEEAYHRLEWMPLAASVCLRHQILLVHRCPRCRKRLQIADIAKKTCRKCKYDLANSPILSVSGDEFGLFSQAMLRHWLGIAPTPAGKCDLPQQPPAVLYRLLDGLRRAIMAVEGEWNYLHQSPFESSKLFPISGKSNLTPAKLYVLHTTAFRGLANWPQGFFDFLDAYQCRDSRTPTGLVSEDLGIIYSVWMQRRWKHPQFQFLQTAFDQYLVERYPLTLSASQLQRMQKLKPRLETMARTEAARILGTTLKVIGRLVELGLLVRAKGGGLVKAEVMRLKQKWQTSLLLKDVAPMLGASEDVALNLARAGLLEVVRGPEFDGGSVWKVSHESAASFVAELRQVSAQPIPEKTVGLVKAAQMVSGYGLNSAAVVKGVLEGQLRAYWPETEASILGLAAAYADMQTFLEDIRNNRSLMSRRQVAQMMGVKISTITAWIERGLLSPAKEQGPAMYLNRDSVGAFQRDYIFVGEAAEILGIGVLAVQKWARNGRLKPVSGPGVDGLLRYMFRRAEVERLRPENRLTGPQLARQLGISRSQLWQWIQQGKVTPSSGPGIDGSGQYLFVGSRFISNFYLPEEFPL